MIDKLNELCSWLSHQKGMMSQDYAKELAKIIIQLRHQTDYIAQLEKGLESSIAMNKAQAERQVKELTDEEILQFQDKVPYTLGSDLIEFARAILRKAQE